jgi:hypothetical protein
MQRLLNIPCAQINYSSRPCAFGIKIGHFFQKQESIVRWALCFCDIAWGEKPRIENAAVSAFLAAGRAPPSPPAKYSRSDTFVGAFSMQKAQTFWAFSGIRALIGSTNIRRWSLLAEMTDEFAPLKSLLI